MRARAFKLRFRRRLRLQKRQVEDLGSQAELHLERNFFRRLERLREVRRFVASWLLLLVLLAGCAVAQLRNLGSTYQVLSAAPGGTYTEGVVGTFTNANPVYATSAVDGAVSRLVFASLLKYNERNQLVGDLANDWSVDERGTTYTVHLKPRLTWHDGKPLTAADVAFTYRVIQSPDAKSPLFSSWQGIKVQAVDPATITFTLPGVLSSFPHSMTNGIIPEHILGTTNMTALRSSSFNTIKPVGAGPFAFQALEVAGALDAREEHIALKPFAGYEGGKPKLASFVVRSYRTQDRMIESFKKGDITAMAGLATMPTGLSGDANVRAYSLPLTAAVMSFFKTTEGVLADAAVRQALVRAAKPDAIIQQLGYATIPVKEPFLLNQAGYYNPLLAQQTNDPAAAKALLDAQGWAVGANGIRAKGGTPLSFKLFFQENGEYANTAKALQNQWRAVGVDAQLMAQTNLDFQTTLTSHSYEALLHGITIGLDPDVFVYWDSAQADVRAANRLNFSEYKSGAADAALEAGRTRSDPALRAVKYQPFLQAWKNDAPALGLYQPRFLYVTHGSVYGLNEKFMNTETGRFRNVHNWMIREVRTAE